VSACIRANALPTCDSQTYSGLDRLHCDPKSGKCYSDTVQACAFALMLRQNLQVVIQLYVNIVSSALLFPDSCSLFPLSCSVIHVNKTTIKKKTKDSVFPNLLSSRKKQANVVLTKKLTQKCPFCEDKHLLSYPRYSVFYEHTISMLILVSVWPVSEPVP
jgi:hypothetical protein